MDTDNLEQNKIAKPRVLHICHVVQIAGAERHLLNLLPRLQNEGFEIHVLIIHSNAHPSADFIQELSVTGVAIHSHAIQLKPINNFYSLRLILELIKIIRHIQPALVHTHLYHANLFGIPAAFLSGVSSLFTLHGMDEYWNKLHWRLISRLVRKRLVVSNFMARFMAQAMKLKAEDIEVIYYGVPDKVGRPSTLRSDLGFDENTILIGTIARLTWEKNFSTALRAMAELLPKYPNVQYLIAGDGALRTELETQVKELGIDAQVHFLGWVKDSATVYEILDIFFLASVTEGLPMVLLEAMHHRIPIVASNITAIPEIVMEGETGFLVSPENPGHMADAMRQLIDSADLRSKMGVIARQHALEKFSLEAMSRKTAKVYKDILWINENRDK